MFRIVNTLCLPGVGDSAVDRVCFSSTHSCNTQVCATGSQREAKQLLHWGKLEVIFSPNEDGFLLNLKPWHEVLWAWSKFTSRSNSFANCFGDLNNGRQRVVGGREVTESCVGESSLAKRQHLQTQDSTQSCSIDGGGLGGLGKSNTRPAESRNQDEEGRRLHPPAVLRGI